MANKVDLRAVKDNKGCHVLHAAAAKGHFGVCKFLVEEMAFDVNSTSDEGVTPMLLAAIDGNVPILRYLLDRGGDPEAPTCRGSMPLHNAVEFGA
nr:unnamed protein product [Digitaria exilis]